MFCKYIPPFVILVEPLKMVLGSNRKCIEEEGRERRRKEEEKRKRGREGGRKSVWPSFKHFFFLK